MSWGWYLRVYIVAAIATLATIGFWEAAGWWGVPFGFPLVATSIAAILTEAVRPVVPESSGR